MWIVGIWWLITLRLSVVIASLAVRFAAGLRCGSVAIVVV